MTYYYNHYKDILSSYPHLWYVEMHNQQTLLPHLYVPHDLLERLIQDLSTDIMSTPFKNDININNYSCLNCDK